MSSGRRYLIGYLTMAVAVAAFASFFPSQSVVAFLLAVGGASSAALIGRDHLSKRQMIASVLGILVYACVWLALSLAR